MDEAHLIASRKLFEQFNEGKYSACESELLLLAEGGSTSCAGMLGRMYFFGGDGVRSDHSQARRWLEVSESDDESGFSSYFLGLIYWRDQANPSEAYRHFRKGALKGNSRSRLALAAFESDGLARPRRKRVAKILYYGSSRDVSLDRTSRILAWVQYLVLHHAQWPSKK